MELKAFYNHFTINQLCGLFGKTRQGFYQMVSHANQVGMEQSIIIKRVEELRIAMPKLGTRKLFHLLQPILKGHRIKIGRDKLFDLLCEHGLLIRNRRRRPHTTDSNHPYKKYHNLIKDVTVHAPNTIWVSDITYIAVETGFHYLSLVTDVYSHKIVGYCLHPNLKTQGPVNALKAALRQRTDLSGELFHHSDRGIQYCCNEYTGILGNHKILISMGEKGNPYENAIAERVNGILKTEFDLGQVFTTSQQALNCVDDAIQVYNTQRPHSSCDYMTPECAHKKMGALTKRWKNYEYKKSASGAPAWVF